MVILCGGQKGGSGKTTLATNLAVLLAVGGADVCLLDADPQASAARWAERRASEQEGRPVVHCVQRTGDVRAAVADLAGRYGDVIVDAGGRDSRELRTALLAADVLLTPLRPSQLDLETLGALGDLVTAALDFNAGLRRYSVLSIAPTNPRVTEAAEARAALGEHYGELFPLLATAIRDRKAYRDAVLAGAGVVELDNPAAAGEVSALAKELGIAVTSGEGVNP